MIEWLIFGVGFLLTMLIIGLIDFAIFCWINWGETDPEKFVHWNPYKVRRERSKS